MSTEIYMKELGEKAKKASRSLSLVTTEKKNEALNKIAEYLLLHQEEILSANEKDMIQGKEKGLSSSLLDRLHLTPERIQGMAQGVKDIIQLPDPVGKILSEYHHPKGMLIRKISVPLGVIGVIFEARPNVASDAAALCLKSGNVVILRGGKEAIHSNIAVTGIMRKALSDCGLSEDCIQVIEDTSRDSAAVMMRMTDYIDVLIPRGGAGLIRTVIENSTVPVIQTGAGNCHIYVDDPADLDMAADIVFNAKTSRPSVCNAAEKLLLHRNIAEEALKVIKARLDEKHVILKGDASACALADGLEAASDEDWGREYLDYVMAVKVVDSMEEAIEHISRYTTRHSECIVTKDPEHAEFFMNSIDAAAVYVNASTRFTDGGEFGFGAEIGISTQKLHARGPIGLPELTSYKYKIYGDGQIR